MSFLPLWMKSDALMSSTKSGGYFDPRNSRASRERMDRVDQLNEVVISFDTTGKMFWYFEEFRRQIVDVVRTLQAVYPLLRIALITHGDYYDDMNRGFHFKRAITTLPFTDSIEEIEAFVSAIEQTNGGDSPECYEYVLHIVKDLPWSENSRKTVILFGDDVPHPPSYTDQHFCWRTELHFLAKMMINVYGVHCREIKHAQLFYEEISKLCNGRYVHIGEAPSDLLDVGNVVSMIIHRENSNLKKFKSQFEPTGSGKDAQRNIEEYRRLKTTYHQIFDLSFIQERDSTNVRFSWWDQSFDVNSNPKYTYNQKLKRFIENTTTTASTSFKDSLLTPNHNYSIASGEGSEDTCKGSASVNKNASVNKSARVSIATKGTPKSMKKKPISEITNPRQHNNSSSIIPLTPYITPLKMNHLTGEPKLKIQKLSNGTPISYLYNPTPILSASVRQKPYKTQQFTKYDISFSPIQSSSQSIPASSSSLDTSNQSTTKNNTIDDHQKTQTTTTTTSTGNSKNNNITISKNPKSSNHDHSNESDIPEIIISNNGNTQPTVSNDSQTVDSGNASGNGSLKISRKRKLEYKNPEIGESGDSSVSTSPCVSPRDLDTCTTEVTPISSSSSSNNNSSNNKSNDNVNIENNSMMNTTTATTTTTTTITTTTTTQLTSSPGTGGNQNNDVNIFSTQPMIHPLLLKSQQPQPQPPQPQQNSVTPAFDLTQILTQYQSKSSSTSSSPPSSSLRSTADSNELLKIDSFKLGQLFEKDNTRLESSTHERLYPLLSELDS